MMLRRGLIVMILFILIVGGGLFVFRQSIAGHVPSVSSTEPVFEHADEEIHAFDALLHPRLQGLHEWRRPEGPPRITLQAGHWKAREAPDEQ